ncbi:MAG: PD-(D/E)XK nuclease-like domain-containing protein [Gammaproteobacteria bacterium]
MDLPIAAQSADHITEPHPSLLPPLAELTPESGEVFDDVPIIDYLMHPAISRTDILNLRKSPAHYCAGRRKMARIELKPYDHREQNAKRFGEAIHCYILERDQFKKRFSPVLVDKHGHRQPRQKNDDKKLWVAYENECAAQRITILPLSEWNDVPVIGEKLLACKKLKTLIDRAVGIEQTILWLDAATDTPCKARFDIISEFPNGERFGVDLKSALDASEGAFARAAQNYGYDIQVAHYLAAGADIEHQISDIYLVAFEKEDPWGIMFYDIEDADLEMARAIIHNTFMTYQQCVSSGQWPNYPLDTKTVRFPAWRYKELNDALT